MISSPTLPDQFVYHYWQHHQLIEILAEIGLTTWLELSHLILTLSPPHIFIVTLDIILLLLFIFVFPSNFQEFLLSVDKSW